MHLSEAHDWIQHLLNVYMTLILLAPTLAFFIHLTHLLYVQGLQVTVSGGARVHVCIMLR